LRTFKAIAPIGTGINCLICLRCYFLCVNRLRHLSASIQATTSYYTNARVHRVRFVPSFAYLAYSEHDTHFMSRCDQRSIADAAFRPFVMDRQAKLRFRRERSSADWKNVNTIRTLRKMCCMLAYARARMTRDRERQRDASERASERGRTYEGGGYATERRKKTVRPVAPSLAHKHKHSAFSVCAPSTGGLRVRVSWCARARARHVYKCVRINTKC